MIEFLRKKGIVVAEVVHRRVFRHEMSEETSDEIRKFLGNLSWSFFGGIGIKFLE